MQGQTGRAASLQARPEAHATMRLQALVKRGSGIIGAPDAVVSQQTTVATDRTVGHQMMLLQCGSRGKALAKDHTKRLSEKDMPRLRGLFSAWEDPWWPAPLAPSERAGAVPRARDRGGITTALLAAAHAAGEHEAGRRMR